MISEKDQVAVTCEGESSGLVCKWSSPVGHPDHGLGDVVVPYAEVAGSGVPGGEEAELEDSGRGEEGPAVSEGLALRQSVCWR